MTAPRRMREAVIRQFTATAVCTAVIVLVFYPVSDNMDLNVSSKSEYGEMYNENQHCGL